MTRGRLDKWLAPRSLRGSSLFILAVLSLGCNSISAPEQAVRTYVGDVRGGRCAAARQLLSAETDQALEYLKVKPQHPDRPLPVEEYYCGRFAFEDCKYKKTELVRSDGMRATVSMPCGRSQDSILPGFSSPFLKYEPREIDLVYENEAWRIIEPTPIRVVALLKREDAWRAEALRRHEEIREKLSRKQALATSSR